MKKVASEHAVMSMTAAINRRPPAVKVSVERRVVSMNEIVVALRPRPRWL